MIFFDNEQRFIKRKLTIGKMGRSHRASVASSRNRRSSSLARRSRKSSVSSLDSSDSFLQNTNNQEIYSGATSEVIPSSITSLHYPHTLHKNRTKDEYRIKETSPLLSEADDNVGGVEGSRSGSPSTRSFESQKGFRFFSPEIIETAPGGSTLDNPEDPVDYNTNWEYSIDKYSDVEEAGNVEDLHNYALEFDSANAGFDTRSTVDSIKSLAVSTGHRRESEDSDKGNSSDSISSRYKDETFDATYLTHTYYQRYYLAEEDLVIGIAGYSYSSWKKGLYYLLCIFTLGLAYVFLRWFPKYRIRLIGKKCPLGKADWIIIENEFGELSTVWISKFRFNERFSDFLTLIEDQEINDGTFSRFGEEGNKQVNPIVPFIHSFEYRYIKFFYSPLEDIFRTNSNWYDIHWSDIKSLKEGNSQNAHELRQMIFGPNDIDIQEKTMVQLLMDEVLHPFYVFQLFSIILWLADDYYYYAFCIFLISFASIVNSLVETKRTIRRLKSMSKFECEVRVWRSGFWKQIRSTELIPGDVFEVDPSLNLLPCDAILVNGECIVNESMLTGESVPVSKTSATQDVIKLLKEDFTSPALSKSYLYNGTKLLKTRITNDEPVTATCVKTGFNTVKGSLIRSMLFPKPTGFKFYEDSFKYIGFMGIIAAVGFSYSTYNFIKLGSPMKLMILRALDIITIVVPPALPATLTIGTTFALNRLQALNIFCTAPTRVNVGGKLDILCFDKTGTLTEEGLDILGVLVADNAFGRKEIVFGDMVKDNNDIELLESRRGLDNHGTHNSNHVLGAMSTCHSLREIDGDVLGDSLDIKMFEFTGSILSETASGTQICLKSGEVRYSVIKEYEFQSDLRRMSVLVSDGGGDSYVFTKGAPEVLFEICNRESIPSNYEELLHQYTHTGYRVIATAYKKISSIDNARTLLRDMVESDLSFTGFMIFENRLKSATTPTLKELSNAEIRTVMCTGDNILTAISVAKECDLLSSLVRYVYIPTFEEQADVIHLSWIELNDEMNRLDPVTLKPLDGNIRNELISDTSDYYRLAVTGDVFRYLLTEVKNSSLIQRMLMKCDIFARMSPDEKHELVEQFQKLDYTVGFCGDGANDCGALKAADVGISLSEAEASIAAPFTSRKFEISCVIDVIKEGRASLVTSFACFKYMSLYSAIQFVTVTILYKRGTNLGDFQFLYIDLFLILPLAIFMSWSKPYGKLVVKRPSANLVSPKILIPICCHILFLMIPQIILWLWVQREPWYIHPVLGNDEEVQSSDNTVLFLFSNFQYILIAVVLSTGPPYRQPFFKNYMFLLNLCFLLLISALLLLIDADSRLGNFMQLTSISSSFACYIIICAIINFLMMEAGEKWWFPQLAGLYKKLRNRQSSIRSKKLFKNLKREFHQVGSV